MKMDDVVTLTHGEGSYCEQIRENIKCSLLLPENWDIYRNTLSVHLLFPPQSKNP